MSRLLSAMAAVLLVSTASTGAILLRNTETPTQAVATTQPIAAVAENTPTVQAVAQVGAPTPATRFQLTLSFTGSCQDLAAACVLSPAPIRDDMEGQNVLCYAGQTFAYNLPRKHLLCYYPTTQRWIIHYQFWTTDEAGFPVELFVTGNNPIAAQAVLPWDNPGVAGHCTKGSFVTITINELP